MKALSQPFQQLQSVLPGLQRLSRNLARYIGAGVGIGIGIGLYGRLSKQELIFFDPDSDPDPDVRRA